MIHRATNLLTGVAFLVAALAGVGLAASFAYFKTEGQPALLTVGVILVLVAFEMVKVTSIERAERCKRESQWLRFTATILIWLTLVAGSFYAAFTAGNDHIFGAVVDRVKAEASDVSTWRQQISEKRHKRHVIASDLGREPPDEAMAKADLDGHKAENPRDWERSRSCTLEQPETRSTCIRYRQLERVLAGASGTAAIDREILALTERIQKAPTAARLVDPSAAATTERPKGIDALAKLFGLRDAGGADLSVAWLALAIALSAELLSNFLIFSLGLGIGNLASPNSRERGRHNARTPGPRGGGQIRRATQRSNTGLPKASPSQMPPGRPNLSLVKVSPPKGFPDVQGEASGGSSMGALGSVAKFTESLPKHEGNQYRFASIRMEYDRWCHTANVRPVSSAQLGPSLERLGFVKRKSHGVMVYTDHRHDTMTAQTA